VQYTSFVDVLLLLIRDGHVLLAQRFQTGYADSMWNVPSGKLEAGEDLVSALLRETREEVGLTLSRDAVRMASSVHYRAPEGHARVGFFFHALTWTGEPRNAEPHKCSEIAWFPLDALPADTVAYTRAGVELFRRGETFGLQGWPDPAEAVFV
jgi:ADP-ribose pyrophosphatase YjhB (NUDIX family)